MTTTRKCSASIAALVSSSRRCRSASTPGATSSKEGRVQIEVAEVQLIGGDKITLAYEAGFASIAPIYYERFWHTRYPAPSAG